MAILTTCECGKQFPAADDYAGKRVACPACGKPVEIPAPLSASDRAIIERLDNLGGIGLTISRWLGFACVLLVLLLVSSCQVVRVWPRP